MKELSVEISHLRTRNGVPEGELISIVAETKTFRIFNLKEIKRQQGRMDSCREHIVMLPYMAQGHIIPFLNLATQIHRRTGFTITILNTPLNIMQLRSMFSSLLQSDGIRLVELPFCSSDHGLPPNTENTENLPLNQLMTLFYASLNLQKPLRSFLSCTSELEGKPPICIISDIFFGWVTDLAKSMGTINITFSTSGAYGNAAYISLWRHLPHQSTDSYKFCIPWFPPTCKFERSQLHQFLQAADGTDEWSKFLQPQLSLSLGSFGWLCNTVEEFETMGLEILRRNAIRNVWCVGPLLAQPMVSRSSVSLDKCIEWLNLHSENSVLYISFGSQNTIPATQMMELAKGLEESENPFIWVIRPPFGFDIKGEFKKEWLPEGFSERMSETRRGLLVHKWAPQLDILSHKSTGAFLSHCGWNSVMESLSQGVPLIGWPLAGEQAFNLKMLTEEMGVALELTRGLQGTVLAKDVKRIVELVMHKERTGGEMRKKAANIGQKIRAAGREEEGGYKGSSIRAINDFISTLLSKRLD